MAAQALPLDGRDYPRPTPRTRMSRGDEGSEGGHTKKVCAKGSDLVPEHSPQ